MDAEQRRQMIDDLIRVAETIEEVFEKWEDALESSPEQLGFTEEEVQEIETVFRRVEDKLDL